MCYINSFRVRFVCELDDFKNTMNDVRVVSFQNAMFDHLSIYDLIADTFKRQHMSQYINLIPWIGNPNILLKILVRCEQVVKAW